MKLKKLEIQGFKSFLDKAAIAFPPGVSAVVGPNGCGKSNIIDAIRWVMGEQSVKQLRGKAMEDVIFAGASGKPPLNMAEVAMTLVNENGSVPEELRDFAEIMITRRLYRSGESAYYLNKQPCRLKDIHNLFLGSGLGTKSFAVIQQGNIGAITDAGPDERRHFIEEAAGVTRFKTRRVETQRKIEATNQNLYRIMDIIGEIKRQMTSLKRQARKAEIYKTYQLRIRTLDITLGLHFFDVYSREIAEAEQLLHELKDADLSHVSEMKKLDAAVETIKVQRWQKNQEISDQKNRKFELQRTIDKNENELAHLRGEIQRLGEESDALDTARADLIRKNDRMQTEIREAVEAQETLQGAVAGVRRELDTEREGSQHIAERQAATQKELDAGKNRLTDLVGQEARYRNIHQAASNNRESLQRRLKQTDEEAVRAAASAATAEQTEKTARSALETRQEEVRILNREIEALKTRLQSKNAELAAQIKQVQTLDMERGQLRSRFNALRKMEESFEWYRDGVKALMKNRSPQRRSAEGILGLVADILTPQPGYEAAVEAALGETLQYVLVEQQQHARAAVAYLHQNRAGRSGFVPVANLRPLNADAVSLPQDDQRLLNHVSVGRGYETVAQALLGHVAVAEDLAAAVEQFNRNGRVQTIVTRQGEAVSVQGTLTGGVGDETAGILAQKQEIRQLQTTLAEQERRLGDLRLGQSALEDTVKNLDRDLQQRLEEKNRAVEDEIEAQKALYKAAEDLKAAQRHRQIIQLEKERLSGEESDLDAEISRCDQLLAEVAAEVQAAQEAVVQLSVAIDAVAEEAAAYRQRELDIQLRLTALQAKLESNASTLRRLQEFQSDGTERLEALVRDIRTKTERRGEAQRKMAQLEASLATRYVELNQISAALETNETDYQAIDAQLQERDAAVAQLQTRREQANEKLRLLELELSQRQLKRENIANRLNERYQGAIEDFRAEIAAQTGENAPLTPEETENELNRCRKKIAVIQDVNLGAIKEYEQLRTRFDFLCEQRDDLTKAIEDLQQVIHKINMVTQERFLATFSEVNQKLGEVFPKLFEGGTARLDLSEPDKPLESGVEIMIQPPGKKVTRMSLLSGGEKALSAIAFIFAIFLIKPTAFCLLDEIDAPLDEANVLRFNNLLKMIGEKSQIIMITHNKKTMEFADTLFGITMEKKGISKVVSVNLERSAA
jgi:chromosome segregation protein